MAGTIDFGLLGVGEPSGYEQARQRDVQGQLQNQQLESGRLSLEKMKQDRDALAKLQEVMAQHGAPDDFEGNLKAMVATGIPHVMDVGMRGLQKLQEQKQFAMLMNGGEPAAAPAAAPAVAQAMPAQTAAPAPEPTNALAAKYPDANTNSVMFNNNNLASDVIRANGGQTVNALPAAVAAAPASNTADLDRRIAGFLSLGTPAAIAAAQDLQRQRAELTKPQIIAPGSSIYVPGKGFVATAPAKPEKEPTETQLAKLQRERQTIAEVNPKDPRLKTYDAAIKKETEFKPDTIITGETLKDNSLDLAAYQYLQTGSMPQLGNGKNASNLRAKILNRAAEIKATEGVAPADAASSIVGNKIDVATRTKATKDFSTGTQGKQVNAFNTAIDHLATMDKLSDALANGNIKLINSLGNTVAKQTGKPAPTNFDAAKQIVTAEVIKAVVASGGGVTERQEAERNFASANSPAQLKGIIQTYKKLLGGQLNSLNLQYKNTTGKTDFESKLTPAAQTELKAVSGATAQPSTNIDALLNKYK